MGSLDTRQTNKLNIVFQSIYAVLLLGFVQGSYAIGKAPMYYILGFVFIMVLGFGRIFLIFYKNKYSEKLKYLFAGVQILMYLYIMILGHSDFRFSLVILNGAFRQDTSWEEYLDSVEKEVLSFFHKNYDKIDVEVGFNASVI